MTRPRRLIRSTSDRKLGGVAGGLGDYFGVDPLLFRIGFAVATLLSGAGAVAYLALLAFTPTDAGDPAPLGSHPVAA
jgi:phage shock protein PspC (stress-responsive transcriptional regulator)